MEPVRVGYGVRSSAAGAVAEGRRFFHRRWMEERRMRGSALQWAPAYRGSQRLDLRRPTRVFHRFAPRRLCFGIPFYISVVVVVGAVDMWKTAVFAAQLRILVHRGMCTTWG